MDVEVIENLVKILSDSAQLTEVEVRQGDTLLRLRRPTPSPRLPKKPLSLPKTLPVPENGLADVSQTSLITVVKSELVGIFYARRPDGVDLGHVVKPKHVLGHIEAMRLMNDVAAPHGGRVQAVLVQDGQPVEYGQALFEIAPEEIA